MAEAQNDKSSMTLDPYQIIIRPLVTEKGAHQSTRHNAYPFEVSTLATKADIRRAVEQMFPVRVLKVRTQNRKGKPRRHKMSRGYTQNWKKAIVELHPDDQISFF